MGEVTRRRESETRGNLFGSWACETLELASDEGGSVSWMCMMGEKTTMGSGIRGSVVVVILFLCICVVLQMLGVPVTLLNPSLSSDILGTSVLEGFSVPPAPPHLNPFSAFVLVTQGHASVHMPLLASDLFHPPVG